MGLYKSKVVGDVCYSKMIARVIKEYFIQHVNERKKYLYDTVDENNNVAYYLLFPEKPRGRSGPKTDRWLYFVKAKL